MLCKKTYKNQITLPKKISDRFKGVEYFEVAVKEEKIVLTPVKFQPLSEPSLEKIRKKMSALGIGEKDIKEAIRWARKNK
ncbi:MAG: AbrB/MazE/SpoVT family DNA-binding domain-containing protein [Caldiserica bacterium]|nr:AbrB/MazE/SpoVT family DNA-binding domain-containing protein [Caldisericota bacterium]